MDIHKLCRCSMPAIVRHLVFLVLSINCGIITCENDGTILEVVDEDQNVNRPLSEFLTRGRVRRSVGFTRTQQHAIVELHNRFRGESIPPAANMEHLIWSDSLARAAQAWSENCTWGHGPAGVVTVQYGQNVWLDKVATSGNLVGITATRGWFEESSFYDYATNGCTGEQCGHYTQLMWASSRKVGCGRHYCPRVTGAGDARAWFITCNYYPPGNYIGAKPYIAGERCTKCESGTGTCSNNLCRNCTGISTQCQCRQVCHCGGTLNRDDCTCACPNGYFGPDCSEYCEDKHPLCGKSPGWPGYWTCALHPQIPRNCPKMCKVCTPPDPASPRCVLPTAQTPTFQPFNTDGNFFTTASFFGPGATDMTTVDGAITPRNGRKRPTITDVPCVDKKCKNGIVRGTDCSCACIVGYEGRECQYVTTELDHGVIFYLEGNMKQWPTSKSVLKAIIAMAVNSYCSQYPHECCLKSSNLQNLLLNRTRVPAYINGSHVSAAVGFPVKINENEFKVDMLVHPPPKSPLCIDGGYLTQNLLLSSLGYQFDSIKASLSVTTNFTLYALEGREIQASTNPADDPFSPDEGGKEGAEKTLTIVLSTVAAVTSIFAITIIIMAIHKCVKKKKEYIRPAMSTKSSFVSVLGDGDGDGDSALTVKDEVYHNRAARMESAAVRISRTSNLFKMSRRSWLMTTRKQLRRKLQVQTSEGKLFPH
ncbi:uncharacterized protein LOC121407062 isoform X1 [Lytechinus variegatus]|uniref:uncharacterized protein LOC121407062 isoform X1 n=1 Tax=Lytechinus variegatus TaxID=7654 RepID=UPI001BB2433C|nr:uncharacterized protein LOC121407062 isoform X1 [Lytechinus variegatus]